MFYIPSLDLKVNTIKQAAKALNTSLPPNMPFSDLQELGVFNIGIKERPDIDMLQQATLDETPVLEGNSYFLDWTVTEPTLTLDAAIDIMVGWIDQLTVQVISKHPEAVVKRWPIEEAAARAYIANTADTYQTNLIESETYTGETYQEHALDVIAHADAYHGIVNEINNLFRESKAALRGAPDPSYYPTILRNAMAAAAPLAAAFGLSM